MVENESIIEKAERLNKELDAKIQQQNELLRKNEELKAEIVLSGRADAGQAPVQKLDVTPAEYTARVMRGEVVKK